MPDKLVWTEVSPVGDLLVRSLARFAGRKAVVFPETYCTYESLYEGALRIARSLIGAGIGPGEHVGLMAVNGIPFLEGLFGALFAGCVVVPINARHRSEEVAHIVVNARLAAILTTASAAEPTSFTATLAAALPGLDAANPRALDLGGAPDLRVAALLTEGERDGFLTLAALSELGRDIGRSHVERRRGAVRLRDPAMILYTSGTTANPKGCVLSHEALGRGAVERAAGRFRVGAQDVHWNGGPLFHIAAFGPLLGCIGTGNTFLTDVFYDPVRAVALMQREGATMAWPWFPAILQRLLDQPDFTAAELPTLAKMMLIVPEALAARVMERFPELDLMQACGMTETSGIFAVSDPAESRAERFTTQGKMVPGMACRIVDPETGADCPEGTIGEIWVKGYCVTDGYYRAPEKTAETITEDGWLRTSDMYLRTPQGSLVFKGRYKDMLKVGGENVAAIEVEAFLCSHPAVRAAEVVGRPDPRLDEVPVAFVELQPGASAEAQDLIRFCQGRIARYKIPVEIRFIPPGAWPMSATKVDKRALRAMLA